jgi:hypothetical protein
MIRTPDGQLPASRAWPYAAAGLAIAAAAASALLIMGRVPICRCGYVKLWHGIVLSSENSQHLSDWYTFSHVIHGFGFYGLLWLVARHRAVGWRLCVALALEATWEVFENTDFVINRYRDVTIALDYFGDSVLNSMSDLGAMAIGFWLAARLRAVTIVAIAITLEVAVGFFIRDNLTLNIIMLIHPFEAIRRWQMGG